MHLFNYQLIYSSLLLSYIAYIMCIRINICNKYYFPLLLFLRWKAKEKQVLDFGLNFPLGLINLFNIIVLFNKCFKLLLMLVVPLTSFFYFNAFTQENWITFNFKPMFLSYNWQINWLGFCIMVKLAANA